MKRVIVYIDGFNFYYGLRALRKQTGQCYYWLNLQEVATSLLRPSEVLVKTKYFTSRIAAPADKQKRQTTFIEALGTLDNFEIIYGQYTSNQRHCDCGRVYDEPKEKMTDVNIAVALMADAFEDVYDTALLISGDSDLRAPICAVRRLMPQKQVVGVFPHQRSSNTLTKVVSECRKLDSGVYSKCLFPLEVHKPDGFVLKCPSEWITTGAVVALI